MSLSNLAPSIDTDCEMSGESPDYFDLPGLPDEMISHILSFLDVETLLRARLNKRLDGIVLESKCYVNALEIMDVSELPKKRASRDFEPKGVYFVKDRSYSADCIRRLTQILSIGALTIDLHRVTDFYRQVYSLIKDFDVENIWIKEHGLWRAILSSNENFVLRDEMLNDTFLLDITRMCKSFTAAGYRVCDKITPDALHEVYKMMIGKSAKMRKMKISITDDQCVSFLKLIGITYREDEFFSNRNIEAVKMENIDNTDLDMPIQPEVISFFDGNLEISFDMAAMLDGGGGSGDVSFEMHESEESLHSAKNREEWEKVIIGPE